MAVQLLTDRSFGWETTGEVNEPESWGGICRYRAPIDARHDTGGHIRLGTFQKAYSSDGNK